MRKEEIESFCEMEKEERRNVQNVENSNREKVFFSSSHFRKFIFLLIVAYTRGKQESWKGNEDLSKRDNDADENVAPYGRDGKT